MFRAQQNAFDDAIGERQADVVPISDCLMPVCSKGYGRKSYLRELGVDFGEMRPKTSSRVPLLKVRRMFVIGLPLRSRGNVDLQQQRVNHTDSITVL